MTPIYSNKTSFYAYMHAMHMCNFEHLEIHIINNITNSNLRSSETQVQVYTYMSRKLYLFQLCTQSSQHICLMFIFINARICFVFTQKFCVNCFIRCVIFFLSSNWNHIKMIRDCSLNIHIQTSIFIVLDLLRYLF